jgi:phenylpropionate dioxygenase-like ring-hydroxylating dioxygenase large terminal subunit
MKAPTDGKRWTTEYPQLGTAPVPIEPCISQAYLEQERELIFRRVWLNVGRENDIPQVGDYLVKDLAAAKTSVLVVRGKDGRIRAFHNMCSHRGNKVVWDAQGSCRTLACKFHGWTYNLEGQLIYVPDEEQFFNLQKDENGLAPIAAETWEGFIFINLDPQPKETLKEYLDELVEDLRGYPFDQLSACYSWKAEIKCNWKVIKDAFQEGYHAPFLHKRSFPDSFMDKENPLLHALAFKLYGHHGMMSVYGNAQHKEHKQTPLETLAHRFGPSINQRSVSMDRLPPGLNPTRSPNWAFDLDAIFPNFCLLVFDGTYLTHHFWPLAVDRTLWEVRTYFAQAENVGQRFSQEFAKCLLRDALLEDGSTLENTQAVLASGAKTHFILQDQEILVRHFHKVVQGFAGAYA